MTPAPNPPSPPPSSSAGRSVAPIWFAAENAFIDCRTPGSEKKLNYAIIGSGVSETDQFINLDEPHGFQLGGASMPPGVNNSLHLHFTAEVFIVVAGTYTFRWGRREVEGEYVGGAGDILSIPTWIFRGFSNVDGAENFIFTVLGRDETGGLIWHPEVLRQAEGHGLHLTVANTLIDEVAGDVLTDDVELVTPLADEHLDDLRVVLARGDARPGHHRRRPPVRRRRAALHRRRQGGGRGWRW